MKYTTLVIDDFYPAPEALKRVAQSLDYGPQEYEGHTYNGVGLGFEPEGISKMIGQAMGQSDIDIKLQYFRLGTAKDQPTSYIHPDSGIAYWAAVLYLSDAPHGVQAGTAFWTHRNESIEAMPSPASPELVEQIVKDGEDESKWLMTSLIGQKFNRIAIYPGHLFHSRYPRDAWGNDKMDGRLTWTCFFNVK